MSAKSVTSISCDDVLASLGAYALGIVDPDEAADIEEHLTTCASCRAALAREQETVGALALAVEPAPPSAEARNRLLAAVAEIPATELAEPTALDTVRAGRASSWRQKLLPLAAAAAVLLLIAVGALGVRLNRAIDQRDNARSTSQLISTYVSSGGRVVTMTAQDSSISKYYKGQGSLLIAPGMEPMVVVAGCPESGDWLTYWVWFAREGQRTRAGKLIVGEDGSGWLALSPDQPLSEFDTIGITVELDNDAREDVLVAPLSDQAAIVG
jgi:hypothetical protein